MSTTAPSTLGLLTLALLLVALSKFHKRRSSAEPILAQSNSMAMSEMLPQIRAQPRGTELSLAVQTNDLDDLGLDDHAIDLNDNDVASNDVGVSDGDRGEDSRMANDQYRVASVMASRLPSPNLIQDAPSSPVVPEEVGVGAMPDPQVTVANDEAPLQAAVTENDDIYETPDLATQPDEEHKFWKRPLRRRINRLQDRCEKLQADGENPCLIYFHISLVEEATWKAQEAEAKLHMQLAEQLYALARERIPRSPLKPTLVQAQAGPSRPTELRIRGAAARLEENRDPSQPIKPTVTRRSRQAERPVRSLLSRLTDPVPPRRAPPPYTR